MFVFISGTQISVSMPSTFVAMTIVTTAIDDLAKEFFAAPLGQGLRFLTTFM